MANDTSTGYGSTFNISNVPGSGLITFSPVIYPFLSRVAGRKISNSSEFAMFAKYDLETFAQPAITEAASVTAPTAITYDRANEKNVTQIFQQKINPTYQAISSADRLKFAENGTSGFAYGTSPLDNAIMDELSFQANAAREQLMGNYEYSAISGSYQMATAASVANKMRGLATACTTNTVDASAGALEKSMFNELLQEMATTGSKFQRGVVFVNAFQKQKLSSIFEFVPMDRNVGGANIQVIETDFGILEVVFTRNIAAGTLLIADMASVYLVNQPVPGKQYMPDGLFFMEKLAQTGASEPWQIYGQLGIDYGSEKLHGTITNLATA